MAPEDGPLLQKLLHYEQCRPDWVFCSFLDHQAKIIDAMTVAAFLTNVRSAAAWLMRQGLRRGDRVVLSLPTSRAFVVGYFAVQWLGAIPVPLPEPSLLFKRRAYCDRMVGVIADCSPAACIVLPAALREFDAEDAPAGWRALRDLLLPWENDGAITPTGAVPSPTASSPDDLAFLQYTSGSTGSPKGVAVTHRGLNANLRGMQLAVELDANDVMVSWMPLYHDMGLVGGLLLAIPYGNAHLSDADHGLPPTGRRAGSKRSVNTALRSPQVPTTPVTTCAHENFAPKSWRRSIFRAGSARSMAPSRIDSEPLPHFSANSRPTGCRGMPPTPSLEWPRRRSNSFPEAARGM